MTARRTTTAEERAHLASLLDDYYPTPRRIIGELLAERDDLAAEVERLRRFDPSFIAATLKEYAEVEARAWRREMTSGQEDSPVADSPGPAHAVGGGHDRRGESPAAGNVAEPQFGPDGSSAPSALLPHLDEVTRLRALLARALRAIDDPAAEALRDDIREALAAGKEVADADAEH